MAPSEFIWDPSAIANLEADSEQVMPDSVPADMPTNVQQSRRGQRKRELIKPSAATPNEKNGGLLIPEDIGQLRQHWFSPSFFVVQKAQFEKEWPWISNAWTKRDEYCKQDGTKRINYQCLFHKKPTNKTLGTGARGKSLRTIGCCPARLALLVSHDGFGVEIKTDHNHTYPGRL